MPLPPLNENRIPRRKPFNRGDEQESTKLPPLPPLPDKGEVSYEESEPPRQVIEHEPDLEDLPSLNEEYGEDVDNYDDYDDGNYSYDYDDDDGYDDDYDDEDYDGDDYDDDEYDYLENDYSDDLRAIQGDYDDEVVTPFGRSGAKKSSKFSSLFSGDKGNSSKNKKRDKSASKEKGGDGKSFVGMVIKFALFFSVIALLIVYLMRGSIGGDTNDTKPDGANIGMEQHLRDGELQGSDVVPGTPEYPQPRLPRHTPDFEIKQVYINDRGFLLFKVFTEKETQLEYLDVALVENNSIVQCSTVGDTLVPGLNDLFLDCNIILDPGEVDNYIFAYKKEG